VGEHPGDLEDDFRPEAAQEGPVPRHREILPDVVGDRRIDVDLKAGMVGKPTPGAGVEAQRLRFLPAVAAALPGVQGTAQPRALGGLPGPLETPESVQHPGAGDFGEAQIQKG
jgi:hypothetical protein